MKTTLKIFFSLLAAAALCWSCQQIDPIQPTPASDSLTLVVYGGDMETKAAPTFESAVESFDFFFFSDAEGTTPIPGMHGHVVGNNKRLDTRDGQTYAPLRYNTSYLYLVANLPSSSAIDHTQDWTLADLLAIEIDSKIVTKKYTALNPYTNKQEETGQVDFCSSLVMDSYKSSDGTYLTKLTPTAVEQEKAIEVGLTRLASKLTVELNVAQSVTGTQDGEVWTPILDDLQAYYVNALNNKAVLDGTPVSRASLTSETGYDYLTYPAPYPLTKDSDDDYKYTSDPAYTYPQTWTSDDNGEPYFKIALVWNSNNRGTANFYYKLAVPRPTEGVWTLDRNKWYKVVADLSVVDTAEDYIDITPSYTIEPWSEFGRGGSPDLTAARFFNVPVKTFVMNATDTLEIPFYSSSDVTAYFNEVSFTHYGYDVDSGDSASNVTRPTYTFRWTNTTTTNVTLGNTATAVSSGTGGSPSRTLPTAARDKNPYKVTVQYNDSHNSGSAEFVHGLVKNTATGNPNNIYTIRTIKLTLKNADGLSEQVTIIQHPAIELKTTDTKNAFVNGHFARATAGVHVNGNGNRLQGVAYTTKYSYDGGQTRYHSSNSAYTANNSRYWLSWNQRQNNTTNNNWANSEMGTPLVYDMFWSNNSADFPYGTVAGDWSFGTRPYQTVVAVSAFSETTKQYSFSRNNATETKTYRIGDPRVTSTLFGALRHYLYQSSNLRSPNATQAAVYKDWESPSMILQTSKNANDGNLIAPRFLVCSFYNSILTGPDRGRGVNAVTYDDACRRAATFQENGYPAGRWRLPTEAEIMFMVQRQLERVIPYLWASGEYWCANGRVVSVDRNSGVATFKDSASNTSDSDGKQRAWARFVYDLWYWGDEPMADTETYWPNKHEH